MSVTWLLDQWVERQPDKTFVVWAPFDSDARRWSYAEMAREARRFAAGLYERGVGAGDFVLMHLDNGPEFLGAWLGCAYLGAVPVTTNTRSVSENVHYFAELMQPACAITQPSLAPLVREACGHDTPMIVTGDPATDYDAAALGATPLAEVFADGPLPDLPADHLRNFAVQFTSGTTSRPKPTVWTHANALWGARTIAMNLRLRREDVTLLYLPLFHANAQVTFFSALWAGNTIVVHPSFSASRFWETCAAHGVTWVSMIPFGAEEAERIGMVTAVVEDGQHLDEALKIAAKIAANPRLAVLAGKESVNQQAETPLIPGLKLERRLFHGLFSTPDQKEGMTACAEKRKPDYRKY